METKDWLNNFIEKNAWSLLVALTGVIIAYTLLSSRVEAQGDKIETLEEAIIGLVVVQKDLVRIQTIQENNVLRIEEVGEDVKTLLRRD